MRKTLGEGLTGSEASKKPLAALVLSVLTVWGRARGWCIQAVFYVWLSSVHGNKIATWYFGGSLECSGHPAWGIHQSPPTLPALKDRCLTGHTWDSSRGSPALVF